MKLYFKVYVGYVGSIPEISASFADKVSAFVYANRLLEDITVGAALNITIKDFTPNTGKGRIVFKYMSEGL